MAAGIDLRACIDAPLDIHPQAPAAMVPSGVAILINDPSVCAFVLARSGLGAKLGIVLGQAVGTIDPDYAGEWLVPLVNRNAIGTPPVTINPGERIAQAVFLPIHRPRLRVVARIFHGDGTRQRRLRLDGRGVIERDCERKERKSMDRPVAAEKSLVKAQAPRGRIYNSITETIGDTPLVRMDKIARAEGVDARLLAKLEFFNPIASVKDRIGVAMIEAMERDGPHHGRARRS